MKKIIRLLTVMMIVMLVVSITSVAGLFKKSGTTTAATTAPATTAVVTTAAAAPLSVDEVKMALGTAGAAWDGNYASLTAEMKTAVIGYFAGFNTPVEFKDDGFYYGTGDATTVAETTVVGTTVVGTTVVGTTKAAGTTAANQTTVPATAAPATAPVGGTMAQVISFFNIHANALKVYKDKVTITKTDGTTSTINYVAGGSIVKNIAEGLLPNDYTAKPNYTFVNGTSTVDDKKLSSWLPPDNTAKMSELSPTAPNGVKSATCVASGSGSKVTIVMNDDITSGATALSDKPKYVSLCMSTLNLKNEDLEPFKLESATVTYAGCTIEAVFDAQGRMTKLDVITPAQIKGNLTYGLIKLNDTDVVGTYKGNYTFSY